MESNKLFAETPPFKLFLRAALPGAIAMLASMLYDTADGILVGRYLGQDSFGAVTLPFHWLFSALLLPTLLALEPLRSLPLSTARKITRQPITSLPLLLSCSLPLVLSAAFSSTFLRQRSGTNGCSRKDCRARN